jgi:hypothetical protein
MGTITGRPAMDRHRGEYARYAVLRSRYGALWCTPWRSIPPGERLDMHRRERLNGLVVLSLGMVSRIRLRCSRALIRPNPKNPTPPAGGRTCRGLVDCCDNAARLTPTSTLGLSVNRPEGTARFLLKHFCRPGAPPSCEGARYRSQVHYRTDEQDLNACETTADRKIKANRRLQPSAKAKELSARWLLHLACEVFSGPAGCVAPKSASISSLWCEVSWFTLEP